MNAKKRKTIVDRGESFVRGFFRRSPVFVSLLLAVIGIALTVILGTLVYNFIRLQRESIEKIAPSIADLPGPKYEISKRSAYQIETIVKDEPHIIAAFVLKYKFSKHENPIIYHWAQPEQAVVIDQVVKRLADQQASEQGRSSDEYIEQAKKDPVQAERQLRNSQEAKQGLIKCGPVEVDALARNPELKPFAKGVCYATIPPFDENIHLAIIVIVDVPPDENTQEIQAVRRALLLLQIDIFNRDFQGRETWPKS